jgi:hypothetical protein
MLEYHWPKLQLPSLNTLSIRCIQQSHDCCLVSYSCTLKNFICVHRIDLHHQARYCKCFCFFDPSSAARTAGRMPDKFSVLVTGYQFQPVTCPAVSISLSATDKSLHIHLHISWLITSPRHLENLKCHVPFSTIIYNTFCLLNVSVLDEWTITCFADLVTVHLPG